MIYANVVGFKDPLKQDLALEFSRNENKDFSILTETHINNYQIHYIGNNWLRPFIFTLGDSHTKGLLVLLYLSLEGVTKVDTDPKRGFVSFKVTPSNDSITPGNSWLGSISSKDYKVIWEIKVRTMETK